MFVRSIASKKNYSRGALIENYSSRARFRMKGGSGRERERTKGKTGLALLKIATAGGEWPAFALTG